MSRIQIPVDNAREGDWAVIVFPSGSRIEGRLVEDYTESHKIESVGWHLRNAETFGAEVSVLRELPDLPTEPNSVIMDVTTVCNSTYALMVLDEDEQWCDALSGGEWSAYEIKSWTPARVVAED